MHDRRYHNHCFHIPFFHIPFLTLRTALLDFIADFANWDNSGILGRAARHPGDARPFAANSFATPVIVANCFAMSSRVGEFFRHGPLRPSRLLTPRPGRKGGSLPAGFTVPLNRPKSWILWPKSLAWGNAEAPSS
jgi:hypothetical protein